MAFVNRLAIFPEKERQALDLLFKDLYFGPMRVHNHSANGQGGTLDWDTVWSDAVHSHASDAEGGKLDWDDVWSDATHNHQNNGEGSVLDHGLALSGLTDDDHTQYALLLGRSGGQTLIGGTGSGDSLILKSTSHGTVGSVKGLLTTAGQPMDLVAEHTDNTDSSSRTIIRAVVGGSSAGDPYFRADIAGVANWAWGIDNSDSDAFIIAASATLGTSNVMRMFSNFVSCASGVDFAIQSTRLIYLDGGGDSYITHSAANIVDIYAGGSLKARFDFPGATTYLPNAHVGIDAGKRLYLDGVSDSYLHQSADNVFQFFMGGLYAELTVDGTNHGTVIRGTSKLWLDGSAGVGGDTHLAESSANVVDLTVGNNILLRFDTDVYTSSYQDYSASSTIGGFSSTAVKQIYFTKIGKKVFFAFYIDGTSNATTFTFTLPFSAHSSTSGFRGAAQATDNSVAQSAPAMWSIAAGSSTVTLSKVWSASGGWTNSGGKFASGEGWFQTD